ncbi:branched-chain amino acid ABC transporter permease [Mycobacterium sp. KBS0706]|uniref:branched-chain amino acid ABC transporter permease n=1 Tax=Mycobacterium sp. KBS0706 TaxID=2578109 RepID=UPI00110FAA44|nr:branched-chain amino acid ABC transporter permease [Mycobacterium sp. KBS0706]TSD85951.1 branched-chain amino acid ABC transporter permease [Mycobacterium sp. KBS0706]
MTAAVIASPAASRARWRWPEFLFWLAALAALFLLPDQHLILNEIAILALFALSLDLILGYAGIVSLGHAAFFGLGAYVAGLLTIHVAGEPLLGLVAAAVAGAVLGFATGFLVLRGSDLTRLMVTLGISLLLFEIANRAAGLTGGADGLNGMVLGPVLGWFEFDLYGTTAYAYSLAVLFALFLFARRVVHSPFGLSLKAIRDNRLRAAAVGVPVARRLIGIYTLSAAYAAVAGALLAQTTQFVSLDVFDFHRSADVLLVLVIGGAGYLYGGPIGAVLFRFLQDWISGLTPQYWSFWLGAFLVLLVLVGRDRLVQGARRPFASLLSRLGGGR